MRDCTWNVYRRYSEFEAFHNSLMEESIVDSEEYPPLPKKRWFEINRWTSRSVCCRDMELFAMITSYYSVFFFIADTMKNIRKSDEATCRNIYKLCSK